MGDVIASYVVPLPQWMKAQGRTQTTAYRSQAVLALHPALLCRKLHPPINITTHDRRNLRRCIAGHEWLAPQIARLVRNNACHHTAGAAGRETDQYAHQAREVSGCRDMRSRKK
ncbi:MAG: hypothetical protein FJY56_11010 [Betaproteobacteria bacterium]|nr:hypothetical protein [Betaproteobacteria bacterium]